MSTIYNTAYKLFETIGNLVVVSSLTLSSSSTFLSRASSFVIENTAVFTNIEAVTLTITGAVVLATVVVASLSITGNLSVGGEANIDGDTTINADLYANNISASNQIVAADRIFCTGLTNYGTSTLQGNVTAEYISTTNDTLTGEMNTDIMNAKSADCGTLSAVEGNISTLVVAISIAAPNAEITSITATDTFAATTSAETGIFEVLIT
jgi:hypothetical protein